MFNGNGFSLSELADTLGGLTDNQQAFIAHQGTHILGELVFMAGQALILAAFDGADDEEAVSRLHYVAHIDLEDDDELHHQAHEIADAIQEKFNESIADVLRRVTGPEWDEWMEQRWLDSQGPSDDQLEQMLAELKRVLGIE